MRATHSIGFSVRGLLLPLFALAAGMVWPASAEPAAPKLTNSLAWSTNWTPLFDGSTLRNWAVTKFSGHGNVRVEDGKIQLPMGGDMTGINWTNGALPKSDYEIEVEAMKLDGDDFFCGLTFPVGDSGCSLILGGWGGTVIGLSCLDGNDASENETSQTKVFTVRHWYRARVRVTAAKIQMWLDGTKLIDASIKGRSVALRPGPIYLSAPLGIATYDTSAAIREIKLRLLEH